MVLNSFNCPPGKIKGPLVAQRPSFVPASRRVHKDYFTVLIVIQLGMALGYNTEFSHNYAVKRFNRFNMVLPYRSIL